MTGFNEAKAPSLKVQKLWALSQAGLYADFSATFFPAGINYNSRGLASQGFYIFNSF